MRRGSLQAAGGADRVVVCHLASGDRWAGAEVQVAALLRALLRRAEFDLLAILLNEGRLANELRNSGIEVKVIPEKEMNFFSIVREAGRFLSGKGVSVLHSHRYKENLAAVALGWMRHIPCLVRTQHGMPEPFTGVRKAKHGFLQWLDRMTARYATDCVIAVSDDMHRKLARSLGVRKVHTIHNGLDREGVSSELSQAEAKRRLGIPETSGLVGTAGRLDRIKRNDILLLAAQHILRRAAETRFLIAGDGEERIRLEETAKNLGIRDRVLFLGHRDDIYDVLRALNILVLCSDHEGMPMALLEALHLGVPVVARRVGGIPEVIEEGVNGALVDSAGPEELAAACLKVLESDSFRNLARAEGTRQKIERFSADRTASETANLYRSLLAGKSRSL